MTGDWLADLIVLVGAVVLATAVGQVRSQGPRIIVPALLAIALAAVTTNVLLSVNDPLPMAVKVDVVASAAAIGFVNLIEVYTARHGLQPGDNFSGHFAQQRVRARQEREWEQLLRARAARRRRNIAARRALMCVYR